MLNERLGRELGNKEAFYHETKTLFSRTNHCCGKAAWQLRHGPIPPERIPYKRKIEINWNWTNTTKNTET
jgi:hypothetical protein